MGGHHDGPREPMTQNADLSRDPVGDGSPEGYAEHSRDTLQAAVAVASGLSAASFSGIVDRVRDMISLVRDFNVSLPWVRGLLAAKSEALRDAYLRRLRERQDAAVAGLFSADPDWRRPHGSAIDVLVAGDGVADRIVDRVAARIVGRMRTAAEEPLRELQAIVRFLSGREDLPVSGNPFAPDVFVGALMQAAADVGLAPQAWVAFLTVFERDLGAEVRRIEHAVLEHFRVQGVDPRPGARPGQWARQDPRQDAWQDQRVRSWIAYLRRRSAAGDLGMAGARGEGAAGQTDLRGEDPARSADLARARQFLAELRAGARDEAGTRSLAADFFPGEPLLAALGELQALALQGIRGVTFAASSAGSIETWRGHLVEQAERPEEQCMIDIVAMLFDHVRCAAQIPPAIQDLLARLQFPVLKAALLDCRWFASSTHPARRFIDRIAQVAVCGTAGAAEGESFRFEAERHVNRIVREFDRDVGLYEQALAEFDRFLAESGRAFERRSITEHAVARFVAGTVPRVAPTADRAPA